jgi:hypothetical protein
MMEDRFALLLCRTGWVGCLLGFAATIYFLFGLAGYVHNALLNFSVAAVLLASALFLLVNFFALPAQTNRLGRILWFAILIYLVTEVVLGFLPPISRDELTHHLAIPKLYAKAGRIIEVPIAPYAYYPMLLDMLYTPWVYWGYDFVPKLIHALYGYLTGLLLFAYLANRMNAAYGLAGFLIFVSTPAIARLSHWGYIDLGITFYTTAALLALLLWREDRGSLRWLILAALSTGFALATKPNGLLVAFVICFLFLLSVAKPPWKGWTRVGLQALLFSCAAAVPYVPWLAKNWFQTGNPFFPFLTRLFASHTASHGLSVGGEVSIFTKRELLYGENFAQILSLPLRIFFSGRDDAPQLFDAVLTPILIILLPWAFKGKWLEDKKLLIAFAVIFLTYAVFLVDMRIRYILPIVPPLVILAVYGIFNVYLRIRRPAVLFAVLILFAAWHGIYLWRYANDAEPLRYISGSQARAEYLAARLPEYGSLQYINSHTEESAKIYLLFIGRRAYYCERDYFHDGVELPGYLFAAIRKARSGAEIAHTLKQKQITHLMIREDLLVDFLGHNLTANQIELWNQFAQSRLELKFREGRHSVYQLHG